jgi:hypothetical protein
MSPKLTPVMPNLADRAAKGHFSSVPPRTPGCETGLAIYSESIIANSRATFAALLQIPFSGSGKLRPRGNGQYEIQSCLRLLSMIA